MDLILLYFMEVINQKKIFNLLKYNFFIIQLILFTSI